jgi:hypothetical protein
MLGLVLWYGFCALNILAIIWMFKVLNRPKFRGEDGDITTEVGYEEDSTGHVLPHSFTEETQFEQDSPHYMPSANVRSGPM